MVLSSGGGIASAAFAMAPCHVAEKLSIQKNNDPFSKFKDFCMEKPESFKQYFAAYLLRTNSYKITNATAKNPEIAKALAAAQSHGSIGREKRREIIRAAIETLVSSEGIGAVAKLGIIAHQDDLFKDREARIFFLRKYIEIDLGLDPDKIEFKQVGFRGVVNAGLTGILLHHGSLFEAVAEACPHIRPKDEASLKPWQEPDFNPSEFIAFKYNIAKAIGDTIKGITGKIGKPRTKIQKAVYWKIINRKNSFSQEEKETLLGMALDWRSVQKRDFKKNGTGFLLDRDEIFGIRSSPYAIVKVYHKLSREIEDSMHLFEQARQNLFVKVMAFARPESIPLSKLIEALVQYARCAGKIQEWREAICYKGKPAKNEHQQALSLLSDLRHDERMKRSLAISSLKLLCLERAENIQKDMESWFVRIEKDEVVPSDFKRRKPGLAGEIDEQRRLVDAVALVRGVSPYDLIASDYHAVPGAYHMLLHYFGSDPIKAADATHLERKQEWLDAKNEAEEAKGRNYLLEGKGKGLKEEYNFFLLCGAEGKRIRYSEAMGCECIKKGLVAFGVKPEPGGKEPSLGMKMWIRKAFRRALLAPDAADAARELISRNAASLKIPKGYFKDEKNKELWFGKIAAQAGKQRAELNSDDVIKCGLSILLKDDKQLSVDAVRKAVRRLNGVALKPSMRDTPLLEKLISAPETLTQKEWLRLHSFGKHPAFIRRRNVPPELKNLLDGRYGSSPVRMLGDAFAGCDIWPKAEVKIPENNASKVSVAWA